MADDPNNPPDGSGADGKPAATPPASDPPASDPPASDPPASDPPAPGKTTLTDGADGPQGAPETYADFSFPENIDINQPLLDAAKPIFKDIGLSQIQAQTVVDMFAKQTTADAQVTSESYATQVQTWKDEIKADSAIGGDKLDESVAIAKKALDTHGNPGLVKMLVETGLGNHPDVIRFFHKVGLTLAEDDPGGGKPPTHDKTPAEIMYPEQTEG